MSRSCGNFCDLSAHSLWSFFNLYFATLPGCQICARAHKLVYQSIDTDTIGERGNVLACATCHRNFLVPVAAHTFLALCSTPVVARFFALLRSARKIEPSHCSTLHHRGVNGLCGNLTCSTKCETLQIMGQMMVESRS